MKNATGEFDEESVFQAVLTSRSITQIEPLGRCCNLRWLDLSKNQITRMEGLKGLAQLVSLDLSSNKIPKVQELDGMPILERLQLQANAIARVQDLEGLKAGTKLRHLNLQNVDGSDFCPVCLETEYQRTVKQMLPGLVALDSKRLHLPDLDKEIRKCNDLGEMEIPELEPWFTPGDLDLGDLQHPEALEAAMNSQVQEFKDAMQECEGVLKEAEDLLKLQEAN
eukprot:CAMPEP_0197668062 /NCGR_PEP_ID=MMETSP1338-20131121/68178_1 /TAXON_ID=43686 ORGANISM="Pelagodinium beii, Strain RCC1491" /NCGR_SAMPLE_ID=MMETSP1338 /ASSEMBLY_ACC=CAM_ASM_000754 /LENGTH=223 /DNA_ID=CAMNT_0043247413 /DNA_START=1 /DNA_END=672 /DNA_ORIENTATION=+